MEPPFDGYFADRSLMDFYDVRAHDLCSRIHLHTGLRFVRMMTGPDTPDPSVEPLPDLSCRLTQVERREAHSVRRRRPRRWGRAAAASTS